MALSGSLADMNVSDVLQLPAMGARTGELRIKHDGKSVRLFYAAGQLAHAIFGTARDEDALVDVLGWTAGEFVFEQGVVPPEVTITDDLHRVLMRAAKRRDEASKPKPAAAGGKLALESPRVRDLLDGAVSSQPGFQVIAFVSDKGEVLAAAPAGAGLDEGAKAFAVRCFALASDPPRSNVRRVWIEDEDGHCLWLRLGAEVSLTILAQPAVSMGVLMHAASKVGATLQELLSKG